MFDESELSIYEELWDNARMITDKEIEPLAKYENKSLTVFIKSFLGFMRRVQWMKVLFIS